MAIDNAITGTTTWTTAAPAPTGLVSVTESGNTGHRLATANASRHGDIGDDAVDLSIQESVITISEGATGDSSFAGGEDTSATGNYSTAFGLVTYADSFGQTSIGHFNTASPGNLNAVVPTDRLFVIGNGANLTSTSDALVMLKNGNTTLNGSLTLNPTGASSYTLPTANGTHGQVLTIDNASSGTTIWSTLTTEFTGLVSVTESGNTGYRLANAPENNHGDIGDDAIDLSIQDALSSTRGATGEYAFATGRRTTASGDYSSVFGRDAIASGNYSTAFGFSTTASATYSIAFGRDSEATGDYSSAFGRSTSASGTYSTAMGSYTDAVGDSSTAMGSYTNAVGDYSIAMGENTTATGESSIAMGSYSNALGDYSTAMGESSTASGEGSTAMGLNTTAESYGQTTLGIFSTPLAGNATGITATDRLLVVGNGTSTSARSDALVILKNGNIGIGDSSPTEGTLVVSGTIVSSGSMTANATLTPDYVFESYFKGTSEANPDYRFPSLTEIEAFVKENHHLPNVPSAAEVKEQGGIVLNRASEVQLEKIEELYLHTIAQQKQLEAQQKEIEELKAMIKLLMEEK